MAFVPRCRVLIAEDEAITALALGQTLETLGYEICGPAASAAEARAIAEKTRPGVALIDMRLKDGVTGQLAARAIQALGIPVILMSGHSDAASAGRYGAVAFLAKPFSDRDLVAAVERAVAGAKSALSES